VRFAGKQDKYRGFCYVVGENLATLSPVVTWKVEHPASDQSDPAKAVLGLKLKVYLGFLLHLK
jgi:hypothetical protein